MTHLVALRSPSMQLHRPRCAAIACAFALVVTAMAMRGAAQDAPREQDGRATTQASEEADASDGEGTSPEAVPTQIREASEQIQYVGPDTYILLDKEGRPQAVPGMAYEDFLEAWKKSQAPAEDIATPRYVIDDVSFDGVTKGGYAELRFDADVRVLVDGRVKVPFGLIGAIQRGEPTISSDADSPPPSRNNNNRESDSNDDGEADDYVTQDSQNGGVVAYLNGRAGKKRHVSLDLVVPLTRDGVETTMQLSCPRAVRSSLTFTTPTPLTDANVNVGTILSQKRTGMGGTRLEVAGPVGAFRLTWHSADKGSSEFASVLSASGAIRVSVDGRSARSDARLTVQSYGGGFDRVRVRLPKGGHLIPSVLPESSSDNPKYRVTIEEQAELERNEPAEAGQVAVVEFPEKQSAPVTINLSTEQPIGLDGSGSTVELAGFEVLGAVRQFGDVALNVANDWQARWEIGENVRQVDVSDLDTTLQSLAPSAAFQYDRQPWSLGVRVGARQSRIHVTPHYDLQCLPDEARLTLRLNYQVFGKRAFEFRVKMQGWQITGSPLESGGLVDLDKILRGNDDTLTLPLAQASTPRAEITLALRRPIPIDQQRLELPLPVPVAESIATGDLITRASPDIELQPDLQNSIGITPVATTDSTEPTNGGATAQFRTLVSEPVFVADRVTRGQEITVNSVAKVEVTQSDARVEHQFDYDVQYVAVKELIFDAPNELWLNDDELEVVIVSTTAQGQTSDDAAETALSIVHSPEDFESSNVSDSTRLRVPLPQPRLGSFSIRVRYQIPRPNNGANSGTLLLPLLRAADVQSSQLQVELSATRGLAVALDQRVGKEDWNPAPGEAGAARPGSTYVAENDETILPLVVAAADFSPPSATTVERVWLQTWFSGDMRQDRAAIRFRTAALQATVELSQQSSVGDLEVLLDGKPAEILSRSAGRIEVRLRRMPATERLDEFTYTLELRSSESINRALLTRHRLTPPFLVGASGLSQVYWQIILPGSEHIIRSPSRVSSASQWQWLGSFWGQRPVMTQEDLESWARATTQIVPVASQNEYLYAGLGPVVSIEIITAPRWVMVLAASSLALVLGLTWLYVPEIRRGWILALAACVIGVLAVSFPVPAMLLAQAAALGIVAVLVAILVKRLVSRPTHWPVVLPAGSTQRPVAQRSDSILMPPAVAAGSTAPTVPLRISDSHQ